MKKRNWYQVIREWEYWPFHWLYGPIYIIFVFYIFRSGFRFFFSASNPTIKTGGFLMESKKAVYDLLPEGTYPATLYFEPGITGSALLQEVVAAGLDFPLVLKPDIGGRGRGVVIAKTDEDLMDYVARYSLPFLVQPLVPYPQEAGIFFVKLPGEKTGKVTGVVGKSFGMVTGDGKRTLHDLIIHDNRLSRYLESLALQLGERLEEVLPKGVEEILVPFGNHARGAAFFNWNHLIDSRLHNWTNMIADQIEGFYYGRLDVRFQSWEKLLDNERFSIIELNGSGSEPTHIYDPSQSVFYAWKEIIRHWHWLWKISRANKKKGHRYMTISEGMAMFKESFAYDTQLDALHKKLLPKPQELKVAVGD